MITIGLPFYNVENTLALAIESVLSQTYKDWKLLLVNDGSNDKSVEIATEYAKQYENIELINDSENLGLIYRLNQIIDLSNTRYIARMDGDDIMLPFRLEKQILVLENTNFDIVSSGAIIINNINTPTGIRGCDNISNFTYNDLFSKTFIIHPSTIFKTDWLKSNKYSSDFIRAEDLELWCRSYYKMNHFKINEPLLLYREGNINVKNYILSMKTKILILKKYSYDKLKTSTYLILLITTYLKIIIYYIFGIFNLQYILAHKRNHTIDNKLKIEIENYIQLLNSNISLRLKKG